MDDVVIDSTFVSRLAYGKQRIAEIAESIKQGNTVNTPVRTLIGWFGFQKRGSWMARYIEASIRDNDLTTEPHFMGAYIDSEISFVLLNPAPEEIEVQVPDDSLLEQETQYLSGITSDPAFRISRLKSANIQPSFVNPNASLNEAITIMMANEFDQLPVMTSTREVKGIISWKSIGIHKQFGVVSNIVKDYMDDHFEVKDSISIFSAIPLIMKHDCVLVRSQNKEIIGIVTPSDLNQQFLDLSESFLLVGEIENQIRRIMDGKFTADEIASFRDPDDDREVNSISDLTFGEYVRLLQNEESWSKVGLNLDRKIFTEKLDTVREIRNNVMHFDPDGLSSNDLATLREFSSFLIRAFTVIEKVQ